MKLWKFLNSRIGAVFVLLIGIAVVAILVSTVLFSIWTGWIGSKLLTLSEKSDDPNCYTAIQNVATGITGALKKGFSSGSDKQTDQTLEFLNCKKKVELRDVKLVESGQKGMEKYVFKIINHSDQYLNQIRVNFSFYDEKGELLDVTNKWISEIKVLEPGQEIVLSDNRWLRKPKDSEEYQGQGSSIKGQITSFEIVKITKEK
jgi:hypothetical protein